MENRVEEKAARTNFIWDAIDQDLKEGRYQQVHTRFPPEPNGYMHIGHCKALIMDFLTAEKYGGKCNLRFDDTNPAKEDTEYAEAIMRDIHWLGFDWTGGLYYASDYYDKLYEIAEDWIRRNLAYVDELSQEEMRAYRGTLTEPGKNSPWRDRPAEESLDLFHRMKAGEFPEGRYDPAHEDRHGLPQHGHARPGHVPHPVQGALAHGQEVVRLSHVRLCAPHQRRAGGHQPLHVLAGV